MQSINQFECLGITSLSKLNDIAKELVVGIEWLFFSHAGYLDFVRNDGRLRIPRIRRGLQICPRDHNCPLSGVHEGSSNFHFHLVLFPTASLLPGEGLRMVAMVAWIAATEPWLVDLLPYPSLP